MAKYDDFLQELTIAVTVADIVANRQFAAAAIDEVITNPAYATSIDAQTVPTPDLVSEFVAAKWRGGAVPLWMQEAQNAAPLMAAPKLPQLPQFPPNIPPVGSINPASV